jgi:hypothetical protein
MAPAAPLALGAAEGLEEPAGSSHNGRILLCDVRIIAKRTLVQFWESGHVLDGQLPRQQSGGVQRQLTLQRYDNRTPCQ